MAYTALAIIELEAAGDDTNNGGIFDRGVSGFPTDLAATSANTASPVVTSASYTFVAGDVGAFVYVKTGTNWTPGWYPIASVSAGAATLDAAVGHATLDSGDLNTVAGCATTASPTAGTFGVDYSQQAAAEWSYTDLVIDATTNTKITSAAFPFGKNHVGNSIAVTAGTNFTVQRVVIATVVSGAATCDRAVGTVGATGGTGRLGGALASPGLAASLLIAGMDVFQKAGTYTLTSSSANVAGGRVALTVGASGDTNTMAWRGYNSVRGDLGTPPTISAGSVTGITMFTNSAQMLLWRVAFDGNGGASNNGIFLNGAGSQIYSCPVTGCPGTGAELQQQNAIAIACDVTSCGTGVKLSTTAAKAVGCRINACATGVAITSPSSGASVHRCIISNCTTHGLTTSGAVACVTDTVAYGNTGAGFYVNDPAGLFVNCIAYGNGTADFVGDSAVRAQVFLLHCAFGTVQGGIANLPHRVGCVTLTGDPFANSGAGDFALNNTAGAGALCRAAGFPSLFPAGLTTGYPDIGAVQSQGSGGGGRAGGRVWY